MTNQAHSEAAQTAPKRFYAPVPTPWRVHPSYTVPTIQSIDHGEWHTLAKMADPRLSRDGARDTAAFIVRAVNSHDDLLAALEDVCGWADRAVNVLGPCRTTKRLEEAVDAARDAIAKAKGETA